jgi:orotate phosphoribosyltransferase
MQTELPKSSEETIEFLKGYGALEEGHFLLASGNHSNFFVKKGKLVEHPWELQKMIDQCVEGMRALGEIDVVLSPAMGGVPVGQQVGLGLHARTIYAERNAESNEMELKRGFEIGAGEGVILVEDVITTGGTLLELVDFVTSRGGGIRGIFVVVNRSGKKDINGIPVVSCMEVELPVYAPDAVPDWLNAIPVFRPGTKRVG